MPGLPSAGGERGKGDYTSYGKRYHQTRRGTNNNNVAKHDRRITWQPQANLHGALRLRTHGPSQVPFDVQLKLID